MHTAGEKIAFANCILHSANAMFWFTVRKCSYFVANTSAQLLLQLVYGRHSSHDIVVEPDMWHMSTAVRPSRSVLLVLPEVPYSGRFLLLCTAVYLGTIVLMIVLARFMPTPRHAYRPVPRTRVPVSLTLTAVPRYRCTRVPVACTHGANGSY